MRWRSSLRRRQRQGNKMMRGSVRKPTRKHSPKLSSKPKSLARQAAYRKGSVAEFYAALYYILRGYAVVQSRYKKPRWGRLT